MSAQISRAAGIFLQPALASPAIAPSRCTTVNRVFCGTRAKLKDFEPLAACTASVRMPAKGRELGRAIGTPVLQEAKALLEQLGA
jgi:hypothetical protein